MVEKSYCCPSCGVSLSTLVDSDGNPVAVSTVNTKAALVVEDPRAADALDKILSKLNDLVRLQMGEDPNEEPF